MASASTCFLKQIASDRYFQFGYNYLKIYKTNKKGNCDDDDNSTPDGSARLQSQATDHQQEEPTTIEEEGPPYVIVVHGPPKVGKSLLIKSLEHYTSQNLTDTIVSGEQRRIQFVECPNNVNGMLDAAKYADAVLLLIDARSGFEMETFEFLNILQVHGIPKVMGVFTYLDGFKTVETLANTKQHLMNNFCTEIYEGARLFCLSGLDHGMYPMHEIRELASFISAMEFHPLSWRAAHPYVLVDRFEHVTPPERVHMDRKCTRDIILYGYLRGCDIKKGTKVHIAGVGDFPLAGITSLADPWPLPSVDSNNLKATLKRHSWHRKLLKTRDPIIVSIGWRRYETSPIYAMEDCSGRLGMLNYTPEDIGCLAMFWGPLAPPNTGVVFVQSLADGKAAFRILATGVVLGFKHVGKILKKRQRIGTPCKILKKTESGIQGKVKKAAEKELFDRLKRKDGQPRERIAKCTFMRRIPRFFNPLMTPLEPRDRVWKEFMRGTWKPLVHVNKQEEIKEEGISRKRPREELIRGTDFPRQTRERKRVVGIIEGEPSARARFIARRLEFRECEEMGKAVVLTEKEQALIAIRDQRKREFIKKYEEHLEKQQGTVSGNK